MSYPKGFISLRNFRLAFTRVERGANKQYKAYIRHLFPSYSLALDAYLADLIDDIQRGKYKPSHGYTVYQPKKSGILRPLTLLSIKDLVVYQALMNYIAERFEPVQSKHSMKRSFGAVFAGRNSNFFFRSWKVCYAEYNKHLTLAFNAGKRNVADFDLVSFYELIDHHLLRSCLSKRVHSSEVLDLLFDCLGEWTSDCAGDHVLHGVPQGPEPSAFLAECLLLHFDNLKFKDVECFRYIDDVKLLAKDEVPLRRALLRLDLCSKELGLVPQAQKIECRVVRTLDELLKTVPSALAGTNPTQRSRSFSQSHLVALFNKSVRWENRKWHIVSDTSFRFAVNRLNPLVKVMRRVSPFLSQRPDCSWVLAAYLRKFPKNREAADILLRALQKDPTYDAAAANYIDAMDICEPSTNHSAYRRVIHTAIRRSEEKSIQLRIATVSFRGRRRSVNRAAALVAAEKDPRAKAAEMNRLFGNPPNSPFSPSTCITLLENECCSPDEDLARYAAALILQYRPLTTVRWKPPKEANRSVKLLLKGLGLRRRAPAKSGVLDVFFKERKSIGTAISWKRALGKDFSDAEQRCVRLQRFMSGDPTSWALMLDTFNEVLLYAFAKKHPLLRSRFKLLSRKNHHPDLGAWLREGSLAATLPKGISWWRDVHDTRVKADLAHAKAKKTGQRTRPVQPAKRNFLWKHSQLPWAELIGEWRKLL